MVLSADVERLEPETALARGCWVKLIAGASNQDLAAIEDLAGIYALAGVHCIDLGADPAVAAAARRGIAWAAERLGTGPEGPGGWQPPWLMVSLNDGDDPHFRKAWFDPSRCPPSCPRPCERVCPARAIPPPGSGGPGVLVERCYGCGRCLPACPHGLIEERHHQLQGRAVAEVLAGIQPDAVEIHTRIGRGGAFAERVEKLRECGLPLRRLAVSCGLEMERTASPSALASELWQRFMVLRRAGFRPLWQLDGRPMSGDLGAGTVHGALRLLEQVGAMAPPGPLQLAGGTNTHTLQRLEGRSAPSPSGQPRPPVAGVAFGGAARQTLHCLLEEAERRHRRLLDDDELWPRALARAWQLVGPWLRRNGRGSG